MVLQHANEVYHFFVVVYEYIQKELNMSWDTVINTMIFLVGSLTIIVAGIFFAFGRDNAHPDDIIDYDPPRGLKINPSDLADNPPPSHPGLQDLDIWTEDQMRNWIRDHRWELLVSNGDDFITGSSSDDDEDEIEW